MREITKDSFEQAVLGAISLKVKTIIEEESANAQKEVGRRIREATAGIIAQVSSWYNYQCRGDNLTIEVKFPKLNTATGEEIK